ncbi:T9SS type A sorting domain-containing protein, partial [bacterium]|nr:T9SS type A sorting domain-containing protein [bacterium]
DTSATATPKITLEVFPNPTKGNNLVFFEFQGHEPVNALVEVRVFNVSGKIISRFSKNISSMPVRLEWDTGNLTPGIYLYNVYLNDRISNSGKICVVNK